MPFCLEAYHANAAERGVVVRKQHVMIVDDCKVKTLNKVLVTTIGALEHF